MLKQNLMMIIKLQMNKNRLEEVQAEILKIEKDPNLKKEPKDILKKKLQENK